MSLGLFFMKNNYAFFVVSILLLTLTIVYNTTEAKHTHFTTKKTNTLLLLVN